jgi:hypothetical protein
LAPEFQQEQKFKFQVNVDTTKQTKVNSKQSASTTLELQSTANEMIPARNAMDAHAQGFMANGVLLLPILKAIV